VSGVFSVAFVFANGRDPVRSHESAESNVRNARFAEDVARPLVCAVIWRCVALRAKPIAKRPAMNSPRRHIPESVQMKRVAKPRSMLQMISHGLARLDGARRANERRTRERLERLERLARLEQWELDRRVREVGEW
jgi:hypothetical protein